MDQQLLTGSVHSEPLKPSTPALSEAWFTCLTQITVHGDSPRDAHMIEVENCALRHLNTRAVGSQSNGHFTSVAPFRMWTQAESLCRNAPGQKLGENFEQQCCLAIRHDRSHFQKFPFRTHVTFSRAGVIFPAWCSTNRLDVGGHVPAVSRFNLRR